MIRNLLFPVLVVLCLFASLYGNQAKKAKPVATATSVYTGQTQKL